MAHPMGLSGLRWHSPTEDGFLDPLPNAEERTRAGRWVSGAVISKGRGPHSEAASHTPSCVRMTFADRSTRPIPAVQGMDIEPLSAVGSGPMAMAREVPLRFGTHDDTPHLWNGSDSDIRR